MSDTHDISIKLTKEQQQQFSSLTGSRPPAITMSSLEFGAFRLAAMAVGSDALPMSKSIATMKHMLREKSGSGNESGPLTITLELTPQQREEIEQTTGHAITSLMIAPDEWTVVFKEEWKANTDLVRVGRSIVIVPAGSVCKLDGNEVAIALPPVNKSSESVFGTGLHPATQLALVLLEECIKHGDRVLDVGTGSGLLAIAAAKLGAAEVLGLDTDPAAVSFAKETVAVNSLDKIVRVREGSLEVVAGKYDLVVANIFTNVIIRLAPDLYSTVRQSGILITSGIIKARADDVAAACCKIGFRLEERRSQNGWDALVFSKP